jgi:hypothetical protein
MRISEVVKSKSDEYLAMCVCEIDAWRHTGVLTGDHLRNLAVEVMEAAGIEVDLRAVEYEVLMVAATKWASSMEMR